MDFAPLLAAIALIYGASNLVKQLAAGQLAQACTQLVTWAIGVGVVCLLAATNWADGIAIGDGPSLGSLNFAALCLLGISLASAGNAVYDALPKSTPTLGSGSGDA